MQIYRDTAAISEAAAASPDPELRRLIAARIQELADCNGDLAGLLNIAVMEPGDTPADVSAALGFTPTDRPIDVIESHPGWYELTVVLSDDGFGVVLYVPKEGIDTALLKLCAMNCPT